MVVQKGGKRAFKNRTDDDSFVNEFGIADHMLTTGNVVYFVTPIRSRRVKIGVTTNLMARLRDLQATNHVALTVLLTIPGDQALEVHLHHRFSADRQHNEWFMLSDEIKQFIRANGGPLLLPSGSYTRSKKATEDDVRAAMMRMECRS